MADWLAKLGFHTLSEYDSVYNLATAQRNGKGPYYPLEKYQMTSIRIRNYDKANLSYT